MHARPTLHCHFTCFVKIPEAPKHKRLFQTTHIKKSPTSAIPRTKQRAKWQPSTNNKGTVDDVEIKLMNYSKLVPSDSRGLTSRSAHNFRVKEGKKLMVKNFIDEHGFEKVRSFAPQLCGNTKGNTIEKLSSSPCFNDDYKSLMMKASRYELTSKCSSTAHFLHPQ